MKCNSCGYENKDSAKFCTKCGSPLDVKEPATQTGSSNNFKYIIALLVVIIVVLAASVGYFMMNSNSQQSDDSQSNSTDATQSVENSANEETPSTNVVSSSQSEVTTQVEDSGSWQSIGSYSGSGSGSKTITVPPGKIMVKLSAYPIKNYATNHLYVSGSNGKSGGVDWGSTSAVKTKSDSFTYDSSDSETFEIDYYETVNWKVEFFIYQ